MCLVAKFIKEKHLQCTAEAKVKGTLAGALGHLGSHPLGLVL